MYDFAIDLIKPSRHAERTGCDASGRFVHFVGIWMILDGDLGNPEDGFMVWCVHRDVIIISSWNDYHIQTRDYHILIIMFGVSSVSILKARTCWNYELVWRTSGELAHELPIPPRE